MIDFSPMKLKQETPKEGVEVFLQRGSQILMMKRKGSHRSNTWALPGGHMDLGESGLTTCGRELQEELGIEISHVDHFDFANTVFPDEGLHYITLYYIATWDVTQKPQIMEPDKIEEIRWVYPSEPPNPMFSMNLSYMIAKYNRVRKETMQSLLREVYWERG